MTITLYELLGADGRRFSPYCWRTRMALAHKGLKAEIVPCKFTDKHLIAFSGQDKVPVLKDGEKVVFDSWDIACYLEDAYPDRPSLFGGPIGRAEARFFNEWMPTLGRPLLLTVIKDIFDHVHPDDKAYFRASREERFGKTLEQLGAERDKHRSGIEAGMMPLRAVLEHQPFFCGHAPACADYIVFGHFQMVRSISPKRFLEKGDVLFDWRHRMLDLFNGLGRSVNAYPE